MCQAIKELMQDSWEEGREEGRLSAIVELVRDGLLKVEEAAGRLNITPEDLAGKI